MKVKCNKIARLHVNRTGEFCCRICGAAVDVTRFKNGYICSNCINFVKAQI